jgi:hypothetical protein
MVVEVFLNKLSGKILADTFSTIEDFVENVHVGTVVFFHLLGPSVAPAEFSTLINNIRFAFVGSQWHAIVGEWWSIVDPKAARC